jgi:6-phosphogluconolactonase
MLTYIGTYTGAKSKGIYVSRFDSDAGSLSAPELAVEMKNPSFLAVHPNHKILYAVGELSNFEGKPAGAVSAFSINAKTGMLTLLNQQSSGGAGPCHVAVERSGKCVMVANYGGGSVAAFPLQADGKIGAVSSFIQHEGSSVNSQRQAGPHAHCIVPDPANRFALVCDLGLDKVLVYRLDDRGALVANVPPSVQVEPGAGPRHVAFDPQGKFVYDINEMKSTIVVLAYDAKAGSLKEVQTVSTLPKDFTGQSTCAEIQVHPSGRFVYGSNRGHDSIAVFGVEPQSGKLTPIEHQSTRGKTPRHFAIDPSGNWLLAENQGSDNIVIFRIEARTGRLTATEQKVEVGAPVCIEFVPGS